METTTSMVMQNKRLGMNHCKACNSRFSKPEYFTVENQSGYLQKIPYCPKCASQNIDAIDFID